MNSCRHSQRGRAAPLRESIPGGTAQCLEYFPALGSQCLPEQFRGQMKCAPPGRRAAGTPAQNGYSTFSSTQPRLTMKASKLAVL